MKKQVLSFNEFIFEAYSMINEGRTWEDVKTLLGDMIDKETSDILAYVEDCLAADAREGVDKSINILDQAGQVFARTIAERFDGTYTDIVEVKTEINNIDYNEVIQGSFYIVKDNLKTSGINFAGKSLGGFKEESGRMKMEDVLNVINLRNMRKFSAESPSSSSSRKGGATFDRIGKGDKAQGEGLWGKLGFKKIGDGKKIEGSGSQNQFYITKADPQIQVEQWQNDAKVTPASGVEAVKMSADVGQKEKYKPGSNTTRVKDQKSKKASMAEFTYVFYALDPKSVKSGKGKGVKKTFTDVKEVVIPVKTPDVTETLVIQDNGILFKVNSSTLTEEGKKNIYNAITSNFTSVSEITIQGSASQEGDRANNEKLCKDRAAAVATYLKEFSSATITASDTASIQPATPVTDEATRKTFRNVTLTIKGTKVNPGQVQEKIVYTPITGKIACDKVTIKELQMTFVVQIDPDKAAKGKLFKKGVDTDEKGVRSRS